MRPFTPVLIKSFQEKLVACTRFTKVVARKRKGDGIVSEPECRDDSLSAVETIDPEYTFRSITRILTTW